MFAKCISELFLLLTISRHRQNNVIYIFFLCNIIIIFLRLCLNENFIRDIQASQNCYD